MTDLNLLDTDVEMSLRDSVRRVLAQRCSAERVRAVYDGDRSLVDDLWPALGRDLGLAGLLVAEERGGAGASAREAAVVLEELGRFVAPVPFLTSAVVATSVLRDSEDASLLRQVANGDRTATLVVPASAAAQAFRPSFEVRDGVLRGRARSVVGAVEADRLLVPAGGEVHAVPADAAGVEVMPVVSLDMTRQVADVTLDVAATAPLPGVDAGSVRAALVLGAALLASEQLGVAQWCLDTTVAYLKERRQFGRVVGGFQALKHRLADLYVQVESARAAARYAAATAAAGDPDAEVAAHLAQAYCAAVVVTAAQECVQLHGGIGMTWEHPAHLYLKRAKADQILLGTPDTHLTRLAELIDLPGVATASA